MISEKGWCYHWTSYCELPQCFTHILCWPRKAPWPKFGWPLIGTRSWLRPMCLRQTLKNLWMAFWSQRWKWPCEPLAICCSVSWGFTPGKRSTCCKIVMRLLSRSRYVCFALQQPDCCIWTNNFSRINNHLDKAYLSNYSTPRVLYESKSISNQTNMKLYEAYYFKVWTVVLKSCFSINLYQYTCLCLCRIWFSHRLSCILVTVSSPFNFYFHDKMKIMSLNH